MVLKFEAVHKQSVYSLYNLYFEIWRAIDFDEHTWPVDQLLLKDDAIGLVPRLAAFIIRALIAKLEGAMKQGKIKLGPKRALGLELKGVLEKTFKANIGKYQILCHEGCDREDWVTADENFQLIQQQRFG